MNKKRKFFVIGTLAMIMLLGTIPLQACVPPETGGSATAPNPIAYQSDIAAVRKDLVTVNEAVGKKADSARVDSLVVRIDGLSGTGQQSSYPKDQLYTKAEVDAKIAAAIEALKVAAPWKTSSSSNSALATNQVTVKLYSISPNMIYSGNAASPYSIYDIFVEVKNGYAETKKILLMGTLTPSVYNTKVKPCTDCTGDTSPVGTWFWTTDRYVQGAVEAKYKGVSTSISPSDGVNCALIMGTTGQIFVGGNQTLLIPIKFQLVYSADSNEAIWTPTWDVKILP